MTGRRWDTERTRTGRRPLIRHPAQALVVAFAVVIAVATVLLLLPVSRSGAGAPTLLVALFTATSATCVTGLVVVDTPTYWSTFGQVVILCCIQVGGFGIMTLASLVGLAISRRLGLRSRLIAAAETKQVGVGDIRSVVLGVAKVNLLFESVTTVLLTARFAAHYGEPPGRALWLGVFHAVSAFNNAGFALYSDNLVRFVADPWVCLPICVSVICGGLGFPVLFEIRRRLPRLRGWSLHSVVTLAMTGVLLVAGTIFLTANEWTNPRTLGPLHPAAKLLAGFFASVMTRTAGFNSIDIGQLQAGSLLGSDVLMFIGGGSAGTAGGIKVTTFAVLFFAIAAEVRGDADVQVADRRIDHRVWRQALAVALLSVAAVVVPTVILIEMTKVRLDAVLFETVSAFATVGLSTGITPTLSATGRLLLVALMFLGRLGPITLVSALALRERHRLYHLPEGRPLIG